PSARRQLLRAKLFFEPSPVSRAREAAIPGICISRSVSPRRPEKSPRPSSFFNVPPEFESILTASSDISPSSNTPSTTQSTLSVANPLAQTSNCIRSPLKIAQCNQASLRLGKILGRYILREVVLASVAVTAVLLVVLLANQVAVVLERAAVNQFPRGVVLQLIWLGALQNLTILVPVGLLLGVVLALGRLYHDGEWRVPWARGAAPASIYRSAGLLALLASAALAWLTLSLSPQATAETLSLRSAAARAGRYAAIAPGKFRTFGGSAVVYAEDVN